MYLYVCIYIYMYIDDLLRTEYLIFCFLPKRKAAAGLLARIRRARRQESGPKCADDSIHGWPQDRCTALQVEGPAERNHLRAVLNQDVDSLPLQLGFVLRAGLPLTGLLASRQLCNVAPCDRVSNAPQATELRNLRVPVIGRFCGWVPCASSLFVLPRCTTMPALARCVVVSAALADPGVCWPLRG